MSGVGRAGPRHARDEHLVPGLDRIQLPAIEVGLEVRERALHPGQRECHVVQRAVDGAIAF